MIARRVQMVRPSLDDIPVYPLSTGLRLRRYRAGDESHWLRIHRAVDRYNDFSSDSFWEFFGRDDSLLAERQYYIVTRDEVPIATATAWYLEQPSGTMSGRVHWVAVDPEWQGRGLARPLLSVVCQQLQSLGHTHAYIRTDPRRRRAINLYLSFGFRPVIWTPAERETWRTLAPALKYAIDLPEDDQP